MYSGVTYLAGRTSWQLFATNTFITLPRKKDVACLRFAFLRKACRMSHTHFRRLQWISRGEFGDITQRFHEHILISGLKPFASSKDFALDLKNCWGELLNKRQNSDGTVQAAISRVYPYEPSLNGVGYVMKGIERYQHLGEAQVHEVSKFGLTDAVTFSDGWFQHVASHITATEIARNKSVQTLQHGECVGNQSLEKYPAGISKIEARWLCQPVFPVDIQRAILLDTQAKRLLPQGSLCTSSD